MPRLADLAAAFATPPKSISAFVSAWVKAARADEGYVPALLEYFSVMPEADQQRFLTADVPAMLAIVCRSSLCELCSRQVPSVRRCHRICHRRL